MLHVIGLIFAIFKGILFIIGKDLLPYLSERNFGFILGIIMINVILHKLHKYKKKHNNLTDHIIYYRFNSKMSLYYSIFIIVVLIVSYITIIITLRMINLEKPRDLMQIYIDLNILYENTTLFLCIYIILIILLLFYTLLKLILLLKKYVNVNIAQLHFYLLSYQRYKTLHNYIRDNLDIGSIMYNLLLRVTNHIKILACFGYYKNTLYRYSPKFVENKNDKTLFWTKEDNTFYEQFQKKHETFLVFVYNSIEIIIKWFYKLHFILLIASVTYDIYYNDYILINTTRLLPILFIYQLYISLCYFITDKPTYDICELINDFYYQDLVVLDEKTIILNGEISEMPTNFVKDFLKYEANGFCRERHF